MNIEENIQYQQDKPSVAIIKKDDKIKYFAVALGKEAKLSKHHSPVPATLVMLKGEINFILGEKEIHLHQWDTFEIPPIEEHEVVGISEENLFTVCQIF